MIIAFKAGLDVIPFENVKAVIDEEKDIPAINVIVDGVKDSINFHGDSAKDFVEAYWTYLSVVEAMTGIESENKDDSKIECWDTETMGGGSDRTKKTT